jgi:hypothetical protein
MTEKKNTGMSPRNWAIILLHACIGWALCAAIMGIGIATVGTEKALVIHLLAAPIFFIILSYEYFQKYNFTSPLVTALLFLFFVAGMDFFVVAILVMHSLEMFMGFNGFIGTWLPFLLIFISTWCTGIIVNRKGIMK